MAVPERVPEYRVKLATGDVLMLMEASGLGKCGWRRSMGRIRLTLRVEAEEQQCTSLERATVRIPPMQ
jgi:hypothetical protein